MSLSLNSVYVLMLPSALPQSHHRSNRARMFLSDHPCATINAPPILKAAPYFVSTNIVGSQLSIPPDAQDGNAGRPLMSVGASGTINHTPGKKTNTPVAPAPPRQRTD
jgi:hypothetical protein